VLLSVHGGGVFQHWECKLNDVDLAIEPSEERQHFLPGHLGAHECKTSKAKCGVLSKEGLVKVGEGELDEIRYSLERKSEGCCQESVLEFVFLSMGVFKHIHQPVSIIVFVVFLQLWRGWWVKERRPRLAHTFLHQVSQILP
jgi:hypothetical protein